MKKRTKECKKDKIKNETVNKYRNVISKEVC